MTVTRIEETSNKRCKVYLDHEFAFVLYKGEMRKFNMREGVDLSQADYEAILTDILPKRARQRAFYLLKDRDYTEVKLKEKLKQQFYPQSVINQTVEYMVSMRYVDDCRYAVSYIRCYEGQKSRKRINNDLYAKGISNRILEKAWTEWEESGGEVDELSMIQRLLEKRKYDGENADKKERQKIFCFLMRKGFETELIRKAMNLCEFE